jgi:hypothetical protein
MSILNAIDFRTKLLFIECFFQGQGKYFYRKIFFYLYLHTSIAVILHNHEASMLDCRTINLSLSVGIEVFLMLKLNIIHLYTIQDGCQKKIMFDFIILNIYHPNQDGNSKDLCKTPS